MTRGAARGCGTRRNWRSAHCRCHAGLCYHRCTVCGACRCRSRLGSCRRNPGRERSSGACGREARALCHNRNDPRCGSLAGDASCPGSCRRSRRGRFRCRRRCCGSRYACCRLGLRGLYLGFSLRLRGRFCCGDSLEMLAHKFGMVQVERARVRLLVLNAYLRQVIDQDLGLDLEFSGQLVDADLIWI
jgi:hypothetical protein